MNVRAHNKHRAALSHWKPWGFLRKTNRTGRSILAMWNLRGRPQSKGAFR